MVDRALDLVGVVEAMYRFDLPNDDWLRLVCNELSPVIDRDRTRLRHPQHHLPESDRHHSDLGGRDWNGGPFVLDYFDVTTFQAMAREMLDLGVYTAFHEREVKRQAELSGAIAHVLSFYETKRARTPRAVLQGVSTPFS